MIFNLEEILRKRYTILIVLVFLYVILFPAFMIHQGETFFFSDAIKLPLQEPIVIPYLPTGFIRLFIDHKENLQIFNVMFVFVAITFWGGLIYYLAKCKKMTRLNLKICFVTILIFFTLSLRGCAIMWSSPL